MRSLLLIESNLITVTDQLLSYFILIMVAYTELA